MEVFGTGVEIGEVAAASSGDEDLFASAFGVIQDSDGVASAAGLEGAHEASGPCAEDEDVEMGPLCQDDIGSKNDVDMSSEWCNYGVEVEGRKPCNCNYRRRVVSLL